MRERGFTLTELMVSMSIAGIVIAAAVPNVRSYMESQRLTRASETVAAVCNEARVRARTLNQPVIVEYRTADNSVAVVDDVNGNGAVDPGEAEKVHPLDAKLQIAATTFAGDILPFDSRGQALSGGNVFLTGDGGVPPKRVRISAGTGNVWIRSVSAVGDDS